MNTHTKIIDLFTANDVDYQEFSHPPSASSVESANARKQAGAGETVGAKALLIKTKKGLFHVLVIPGHFRVDGKKVKALVGKHSFATSTDMVKVTKGLLPGHMPPFGPQLFTEIDSLIIDENIPTFEKIGFNAASPEISIILTGKEYLRLCRNSSLVESITID